MEIPLTGVSPHGTGWVPVDACTLPTTERPLRAAEFDVLFATHLRDIERPDRLRVRMVLSGDTTLPGRIQRLVDAESSCCSFFRFRLARFEQDPPSASAETVMSLEIEVPPEHRTVLDALVALADEARRRAS